MLGRTTHETWKVLPEGTWLLQQPIQMLDLEQWNGFGFSTQLDGNSWLNMVYAKPNSLMQTTLTPGYYSALVITILIFAFVALFVARRISRPLRHLAKSAERLGRGEELESLPEKGPDDIRCTVAAFNRMQIRLRRFLEDRTRMLAAIGYDLRTPITSLRLRTEFISDAETREKFAATLDEMQVDARRVRPATPHFQFPIKQSTIRNHMNLKFDNQLALVTASTGGIGLEIARSLAGEGVRVIVNGRSASSVDAAIASIRRDVPEAKLERLIADNGAVEGTAETIRQFPDVNILVNNLGIYEAVGFFDETDEAWQRLFEVNILSGVRLARHYLKTMLERKAGRVIFISSESAISPAPEMAHYAATKTMQLSVSRSLAELTKGTAVTVNTILPGSSKTEGVEKFVQDIFPDEAPEEAERRFMRENRPTSLIERLIEPREIADLVTFVSSPLSSAINGAALRIDGGLVRSVF